MSGFLRIAQLALIALLLALLAWPAAAHATAPASDQPVLTVGVLDAQALGPQQRTPLRAHLAMTDGTPIADALVIFSVDGQRDGQARTNAAGEALWRIRRALPAGRYTIQATFEGRAGLAAARATFALKIEPASITLQPAPAEVGGPVELVAHISRASGGPIGSAAVTFFVDGKRIGIGRSAADGKAILRVKRNLPVGDFPVEAVFEGVPGVLPARATAKLTVAATWLEIETVPHLAGARFALDDRQFVADQTGIARIAVERAGGYTLTALPWEADSTGIHATFARWEDDLFAPQRRVQVPAGGVIQAGFNMNYLVRTSFVDLESRPVDPGIVSTVVMTSSDRIKYTLNGAQPRWLPGSRVIRLGTGLEARPIGYVAGNVIVDGSNVVNQGQQRFDPTAQQEWPIKLLLHTTHFIVRDAMFGFPIGSSIQLTYPDGTSQVRPLGPNGELTTGLLARGGYTASITAPGISAVIPIVLSRDQEVRLLVISYLDLAVLSVIMASIGFGLLFAGRPQLLVLLRSPRALAATLLTYARALKPSALTRRQPLRADPRLRLLDPPVMVATLLMIVGAGGAASAMRFTPASATAAQPETSVTVVATATAAPQLVAAATAKTTPTIMGPLPQPSPPPATIEPLPQPSPPPATIEPLPAPAPQIEPARPQTQLTFRTWLRPESKGQAVALLQQRLRELSYFTYPENTGLFGVQTLAAVRDFQTDRGLPVTGLVGPLTIEALNNCAAGCTRANNPQEET